MSRRKYNRPVENQRTASWANAERTKTTSNVPVPSEFQSAGAKEYADENEK